MDNKIMTKINRMMKVLDSIADTYGIARATHIALLANHLLELNGMIAGLVKELEELREFKEEHTATANKAKEES